MNSRIFFLVTLGLVFNGLNAMEPPKERGVEPPLSTPFSDPVEEGPLFQACFQDDTNALKQLLITQGKKLSFYQRNSFGETILHRVCVWRPVPLVHKISKLLLFYAPQLINVVQIGSDSSPLHALAGRHEETKELAETIHFFCSRGAYANRPDLFGFPPLLRAIEAGNLTAMRALYKNGAYLTDDQLERALQLAGGRESIIKEIKAQLQLR